VIHTKPSAGTVEETVARLQHVIAENGLKVFAVFDHSGEAAANGLTLRQTKVVVFLGLRALVHSHLRPTQAR